MFINLNCPINSLGYGVAGFNILKHLVKAGHTVSLFPIGGSVQIDNSQESQELIKSTMKNAEFFNPQAPTIRIWHQYDMAQSIGGGERIGFPIFELNTLTDREVHHLGSVDRLFVCSKWAKGIVHKYLPKARVDVIPLGVDNTVFYRNKEDEDRRPYWAKNKTIFMNVGKWEIRKGHVELLEAFNKAFGPNDDVELWMMNDNPFIGLENEQWKARYLSTKNGGLIKIIPRVKSQHQLRVLFNQVDCGVFPSHAEGWNLEPLEMMACGAHIIATDYSGHTEYLTDRNSLLVPSIGLAPARDGKWFHGTGDWCVYSVDTLAERMMRVHALKKAKSLSRLGNDLDETVKKYSWDNSVREIEAVL